MVVADGGSGGANDQSGGHGAPRRGRTIWWALTRLFVGTAAERRLIRYRLGELAAKWIGDCWVPEDHKLWREDQEFLRDMRRLAPDDPRSAERKYTVREIVRSLAHVPGDTAECGAFRGATSYFICQARGNLGTHHVFDSFAGLSVPDELDQPASRRAKPWKRGELVATEAELRANLAPFPNIEVHPGWIPERFPEVADRRFAFVHIDVDLYEPTRASLEFFLPRLSPGGMIVCDDYGFTTCPGAKRACEELAEKSDVSLVSLATGQALILTPPGK